MKNKIQVVVRGIELKKENLPWKEWRIVEKIGEGAHGKVYKVMREHHGITSYAAMKVVSIPQNANIRSNGITEEAAKSYFEGVVTDFIKEVRLMVSLKGAPNIVTIEDFDVVEKEGEIGWDIYIRMELLTSLNDYVEKHPVKSKDIIKLGEDICTALDFCNGKSIIHRDIKPENIFVSEHGDFKIGDFGVARELEKTSGALSIRGTHNYMAPEVVVKNYDLTTNIRSEQRYDSTVDIYSLGLVLYKLMNNNRLPFIDPYAPFIKHHEITEALDRRFSGEPIPAPVATNKALVEVVLKACTFKPSQRYQSAREMKEALKAIKNESEGLRRKCKECNNDFVLKQSTDLYCQKVKSKECAYCTRIFEIICREHNTDFCSEICEGKSVEDVDDDRKTLVDIVAAIIKQYKKKLLIILTILILITVIGIAAFSLLNNNSDADDVTVVDYEDEEVYITEIARIAYLITYHDGKINELSERFNEAGNRQEQLNILAEAREVQQEWLSVLDGGVDIIEISISYEEQIETFTNSLVNMYFDDVSLLVEAFEEDLRQDIVSTTLIDETLLDISGFIAVKKEEYEMLFANDIELSSEVYDFIESEFLTVWDQWPEVYNRAVIESLVPELEEKILLEVGENSDVDFFDLDDWIEQIQSEMLLEGERSFSTVSRDDVFHFYAVRHSSVEADFSILAISGRALERELATLVFDFNSILQTQNLSDFEVWEEWFEIPYSVWEDYIEYLFRYMGMHLYHFIGGGYIHFCGNHNGSIEDIRESDDTPRAITIPMSMYNGRSSISVEELSLLYGSDFEVRSGRVDEEWVGVLDADERNLKVFLLNEGATESQWIRIYMRGPCC